MESCSRGLYSGMKLQDKEIQLIDLCSALAEPGDLFFVIIICLVAYHIYSIQNLGGVEGCFLTATP